MKKLCLGTAMWGWSVDISAAFAILDCFYHNDGRYVDTATNYPLNGDPLDHKKAIFFLSQWCEERKVSDLKITCKIGSINNTNTPENDLSHNYLIEQINWLENLFTSNLSCIMLHWDNRCDFKKIEETCAISHLLIEKNLELGLSGITNPIVYSKVIEALPSITLNIQVKHNFLHSTIESYHSLSQLSPNFWAYGISVSGLKISAEQYRENSYVSLVRGQDYHSKVLTSDLAFALNQCIENNESIECIYHIAMAYSEDELRLKGYIVAPSTHLQMEDIFKFIQRISSEKVNLKWLEK